MGLYIPCPHIHHGLSICTDVHRQVYWVSHRYYKTNTPETCCPSCAHCQELMPPSTRLLSVENWRRPPLPLCHQYSTPSPYPPHINSITNLVSLTSQLCLGCICCSLFPCNFPQFGHLDCHSGRPIDVSPSTLVLSSSSVLCCIVIAIKRQFKRQFFSDNPLLQWLSIASG